MEELTTSKRSQEGYYLRIILAKELSLRKVMNVKIARILNRDKSTIDYYLKQYDSRIKYDKEFKMYTNYLQSEILYNEEL